MKHEPGAHKNLGETEITGRGFQILEFTDWSDQECSLQQSSAFIYPEAAPGGSAIWLGVDEARMHLSKEQVRDLYARLGNWLDTEML